MATSSLELGIDMGAVDLVIQVESPRSVARGMQRIGRAGHQVGAPSRGRVFPKYRGDLLECAAVVERMRRGAIEETHVPRQPLDVLAQQLVAICSDGVWTVDELEDLVRGAYPFADLSREQLEGVLDMLAGRYPSDEFAELRPRVVWDRTAGTIRGRDGSRAARGAERGHDPRSRPVRGRARPTARGWASWTRRWSTRRAAARRSCSAPRPGGSRRSPATAWWSRPPPARPARCPSGRARASAGPSSWARRWDGWRASWSRRGRGEAARRLRSESAFDARAAANLMAYLEDQAAATGTVPSDRAIVVERFRDEIGDWRLCVLTPFGARVHAPWALALGARLRAQTGHEAHTIWADDGIAIHLPDADEAPAADSAVIDPAELEELVLGELAGTALFGARFRENAARALLIPRRRPGQRTPLWQQRLKASSLLPGGPPVRQLPGHPRDVPRVPGRLVRPAGAARGAGARARRASSRWWRSRRRAASPFAGSLLFEYVASYMYEDDTPVAERRAQALSLNRDLLRELLGQEELRDLIDADALAALEADLQGLSERARARGADGLHDLLRRIGDLSVAEIERRVIDPAAAPGLIESLVGERRACVVRVGGEPRVIAAEDAGRYRDGLGVMPPAGLPEAFLEDVPGALRAIVARYARARGPFHITEPAERYALDRAALEAPLAALESEGALVRGELRPGGSGREWCDAEVVRRLRRASLATLRREIEPADPRALGRFLPDWQRVDRPGGARGADALREALGDAPGARAAGRPVGGRGLPAARRRLRPGVAGRAGGTRARSCGSAPGRAAWAAGAWPSTSARTRRCWARPPPTPPPTTRSPTGCGPPSRGGASFWDDLLVAGEATREEVFTALWALVWAGEVTNDLWLPLRAPRRLPALTRPGAGARAPPGPGPGGALGGGRAAGRSPGACSPTRRRPTSAAARWPSCWWSATAC